MKATKTRWEMKTARFLPPVGYTSIRVFKSKKRSAGVSNLSQFLSPETDFIPTIESVFALLCTQQHVVECMIPVCSLSLFERAEGGWFCQPPHRKPRQNISSNQIKTTIPPSDIVSERTNTNGREQRAKYPSLCGGLSEEWR